MKFGTAGNGNKKDDNSLVKIKQTVAMRVKG